MHVFDLAAARRLRGHADRGERRVTLLDLASTRRLHEKNNVLLIGTRFARLKDLAAMSMNFDHLFADMKQQQPEAIVARMELIMNGVDASLLVSAGLQVN